jgi:putative ABC transport system permease protein
VHMSISGLQQLLGEEPLVTEVLLRLDPLTSVDLDARLKHLPLVAGTTRRQQVINLFRERSAESMLVTSLVLTIFGAIIAIGIIYNAARVALSMRSRDLASMRVLGFTQAEISTVLLGELGTYLCLGLLPGLALGRYLAGWMARTADPEVFRLPAVVSGRTYGFAVAVTVCAAGISALLARSKLNQLDLVGVLKTKD